MSVCKVCEFWAREGGHDKPHHERCPENPEYLRSVIVSLLDGIKRWAADEDGIPEDIWPAVTAAEWSLIEVRR